MIISIGLLYDKNSIERIRTRLKYEQSEDLGYAIELVTLFCNSTQKIHLLPLLNYFYNPIEHKTTSESQLEITPELHNVIKKYLNYSSTKPLGKLSCLSALYVIKKLKLTGFDEQLNQLNQIHSKILICLFILKN